MIKWRLWYHNKTFVVTAPSQMAAEIRGLELTKEWPLETHKVYPSIRKYV